MNPTSLPLLHRGARSLGSTMHFEQFIRVLSSPFVGVACRVAEYRASEKEREFQKVDVLLPEHPHRRPKDHAARKVVTPRRPARRVRPRLYLRLNAHISDGRCPVDQSEGASLLRLNWVMDQQSVTGGQP